MKLRQSARHFAARRALTAPVVGPRVVDRLVDLHVRVFADRADPAHREARRPRLEAFFACTTDADVDALEAGYPEAEAREITHVQADVDVANHGWTEMLEVPLEEVDAHLDRYAEFFAAHGVTREDPLGDFRTRPVPEAPATPERLASGDAPHAEGGYADAPSVERPDGEVVPSGAEGPADDVDPAEMLGLDDEAG